MKPSFLSIITLTAIFLTLSACGQKGALYLPEKQEQPIVTAEHTQANTTQLETTKTDSVEDTQ